MRLLAAPEEADICSSSRRLSTDAGLVKPGSILTLCFGIKIRMGPSVRWGDGYLNSAVIPAAFNRRMSGQAGSVLQQRAALVIQ
jgi:hypothetical protein